MDFGFYQSKNANIVTTRVFGANRGWPGWNFKKKFGVQKPGSLSYH